MQNELFELAGYGIELLLVATWRALPLCGIALLVDLAVRRRLASKYHAWLWMLVAIRLMLPVSHETAWSLHGPLDQCAAYFLDAPSSIDAGLAVETAPTPWRQIQDPAAQPAVLFTEAFQQPMATLSWQAWGAIALFSAWAIIAAGMLLRSVFASLRFARQLRTVGERTEPDLIEHVQRECDVMGLRRRPSIKVVPTLTTPAVFGLFRSTICLPANALASLSTDELRWVVRHELAHIRRRDAWLFVLAAGMQALHWFNPLAWLTMHRLRRHVEAAADELATAGASLAERVAYGRLLLRLAEQSPPTQRSPALGLLAFVWGRSLQNRIELLTEDRPPQRRWVHVTLALATLTFAAIGLTDAAEQSIPRGPAIHLPPLDLTIVRSLDGPPGPSSTRHYDVDAVLGRIRQAMPEADPSLFLLTTSKNMLATGLVQVVDGRWMVVAPAREHEAFAALLNAWRTSGPRQIAIELRIIRADLARAMDVDWIAGRLGHVNKRGPQPMVAARISDDQLRQFVQQVQANADNSILAAPKVTLFNGQSAVIAAVVQHPMVTEVEPRDDGSLQPVVEVLDAGWKVKLQPAVAADESLQLDFELTVSQLGETRFANLPFRQSHGSPFHVTVQAPSVTTTSLSASVQLPLDESVLIALPELFDAADPQASHMAVFYALTPRLLDESP